MTIRPRARATRCVDALPPTSTMRACPCASKCVKCGWLHGSVRETRRGSGDLSIGRAMNPHMSHSAPTRHARTCRLHRGVAVHVAAVVPLAQQPAATPSTAAPGPQGASTAAPGPRDEHHRAQPSSRDALPPRARTARRRLARRRLGLVGGSLPPPINVLPPPRSGPRRCRNWATRRRSTFRPRRSARSARR